MRNALVLTVVLAAIAAVGVPALAAATRSVKVGDNYFVRDGAVPTVTVKRNTRVVWRWVGDSPHNVTVRRGPTKFRSKTMTSGTYARKLSRTGTYRIYCTIHGAGDQSMVLRVRR